MIILSSGPDLHLNSQHIWTQSNTPYNQIHTWIKWNCKFPVILLLKYACMHTQWMFHILTIPHIHLFAHPHCESLCHTFLYESHLLLEDCHGYPLHETYLKPVMNSLHVSHFIIFIYAYLQCQAVWKVVEWWLLSCCYSWRWWSLLGRAGHGWDQGVKLRAFIVGQWQSWWMWCVRWWGWLTGGG